MPALAADPAQVRLGEALAARVTEVTRLTVATAVARGLIDLTSPRFAKQIRDVHTLDEPGHREVLDHGPGHHGDGAQLHLPGWDLRGALRLCLSPTLSRSYEVWRDANLRVMNEEVNRLDIGQAAGRRGAKHHPVERRCGSPAHGEGLRISGLPGRAGALDGSRLASLEARPKSGGLSSATGTLTRIESTRFRRSATSGFAGSELTSGLP